MRHAIRKKEGFQGQKLIVVPRPVISDKCINNRMINPLYVTDIGYYPKARDHYMKRSQGAEQCILIYCHEGRGRVLIKDREYRMETDDFILIPAGIPHAYSADENLPWTIYWLHFKGKAADEIAAALVKKHGVKGCIRSNDRNIELFNEIYLQLEKGYSIDNLVSASMSLWYFLSTFLFNDKYDPGGRLTHRDPVDLAIDFLGKNTGRQLSVAEMAHQINLSPSHFSYLFRKRTGFSPVEYFNHLKVQKACQYLRFTTLRIKEIAQELGIADQYYFSRMFTKIMGSPPNEYRGKRSR